MDIDIKNRYTALHQILSQQSKEQLYQTSKVKTLWMSQEGTSKSKKLQ